VGGVCGFYWRGRYSRLSGGTRVFELASDGREATPWKGARPTSTRAPKLNQNPLGGWSTTPTARRTTAARGAARSDGADFRSAAAGTIYAEGFGYNVGSTRHL
jgi:hypothetical protein